MPAPGLGRPERRGPFRRQRIHGKQLTGFGLGLIARDGLMGLLALIFTGGNGGLILYHVI